MTKKLLFYNFSLLALIFMLFTSNIVFVGLSILCMVCVLIACPHRAIRFCMQFSVTLSVVVTVLIVYSLSFESYKFFQLVSFTDFLFGTQWKPYYTIQDQGIVMLFGIVPLLVGTFLVTIIAMLFSAPIGLFSAIYLSKYATERARNIIKPVIELLAGIPTVVYGYFAMNTVSPAVCKFANFIGLEVYAENALSAGIVIGIMIIPLFTSLIDDIIQSVPKSLYYGALALGSTKSEAIFKVVIPSAFSGILSAILLAVSRALGETMIVLMATGVRADLTFNPLHSITTITVQIATLLKSEQNFDDVSTLSAYALGLTLFIVTWILNAIAFTIVKKYRVGY